MYKKLYYGNEARQAIADGVDKVADAVKVTLGAMGKNVVIGRDGINPHITKDGVTVAKSIFLKDYTESIGANLVKEVAMKTVELAGDGTTTATILTQALINQSICGINDGGNSVHIKQGLEKALQICIEELLLMSKNISTDEELLNIATISANNDPVLGQLISDAFKEVGKHGIINVELGRSGESSLNFSKGFKIDQGFISPYFATKGKCVLQKPLVLLVDGRITNFKDIEAFVQKCSQSKQSLLIICEGIDELSLEILTHNHQNKAINVCVIKSDGWGEERITGLEDIRYTVGGVMFGKTTPLSQVSFDKLGYAETIIVTSYSTEIIGGKLGDKYKKEVIKEIEEKLDTIKDGYEKDVLKKRLGNLQASVSTIKIGGFTDTEIKERYDRVDDSIHACRSALQEGYVMGGGTCLMFLSQKLDLLSEKLSLNKGQMQGFLLLMKVMYEPIGQMLLNAGCDDDTINEFIAKVINEGYGKGVDVRSLTIEDFALKGIIDPTKVVRVCLESSVSIAATLLTTECVISEDPEVSA